MIGFKRDNNGRTPLHLVANKETAKLLVDLGADKSAEDDHGRTPYSCATSKGVRDVIRFFQTDMTVASNVNQSATHSISKKPDAQPYKRLEAEGKALMKKLKYKEAAKKFLDAYILLSKNSSQDTKTLDQLDEYYEKSKALAQPSVFPHHFDVNAPIDTLAILASRVRVGAVPPDQVYDFLKTSYSDPMLRPFLDYVAMDFLLNEKAHIRIVKHVEAAAGFFRNSSIVAEADNSLDNQIKGTIMHEISHYYFFKAYQNASDPNFEGDNVREEEFVNIRKKVLINLYKEIDPTVDEIRLMQMDTWDIGKELYAKEHFPSEIRSRILAIYNTSYQKTEEAREFVVRLNDLLGRGYQLHELKVLQPLIEFTSNHLITDCYKFNKELTEIVTEHYSPKKKHSL